MEFPLQNILFQLNESKQELQKANKQIKSLKIQLQNSKSHKYSKLKEENILLKTTYKLCKEDIKKYIEEIEILKQKIKLNEFEIIKLQKEKNSLKGSKTQNKNIKNSINNFNDLQKTLKLELSKDDDEDIKNEIKSNINNKNNKNNKIQNYKELEQKMTDYKQKFIELKKKCNEFHHDLEQIKNIGINYENYLKEINQQMNVFNEALNISINNENSQNNNMNKNKLDEIYSQIDVASVCLVELDEMFFNIKNVIGDNIEHLLNEINNNLLKIDKHEYNDENSLKEILGKINYNIEEIQTIKFIFEEGKNNFYNTNHNVEEEFNKLRHLYNKFVKEYKKNKPINNINQNVNNNNNIRQTNNNVNYNNNNIIINNNDNNINNNENNINNSILSLNIQNRNVNPDMYKTAVLFKNREIDYIENYIEESQILRKNWHETCYVYDDYYIYDIYYDIKAVGLSNNHYFTSTSHGFYYDTIVEIQLFLVNNAPVNFRQKRHSIEFKINLYNLQTAKVHIIYKEMKDLTKLGRGKIEERKIIRNDYFGLDKSLSGQMAKFSLILKGSFDIVNFSEYFLIKNTNNKNDVEYVWGGRVPYGGKTTLIMFSKREAVWSFNFSSKFHSYQNIRNTTFRVPIEFIGGNNEILSIKASSPQTSNIILNEEKREYIIKYRNTHSTNGEFVIQGELQNKSYGEWLVDLSNEEIERKMPQEDVLCKPQLNKIARKIIEDFDKQNKNKDYKFLDYMKIAMWVHENIEYNYNYVGKTEYSAIDIYNMRLGVCHHFTRLSNALLYSLGYKVIYVSGYACKNNKEFNTDSGHAWSLINLDNKWYPFDSTWGIFSGKLPISHIFGTFFNKSRKTHGSDDIQFDRQNMIGKFIA